jgi:hypothetical protein
MKFNAHAKIEIALAAMLLLGSCGDYAYRRFTEGEHERIEIADVNARRALSRLDYLESRVSSLEERLDM